ncbi:hypothetical protein [Algoriphagus formosus]|uniref:hypothetical protein n=1 Tax=Algoriphagus formosus TaxID=2007308 RepID=UPI003F715E72
MGRQFYIWTGDYVGNSLLFWRKGKAGYTTDINQAHVFNYAEALQIQESTHGEHRMISKLHCDQIATKQVHADHVKQDFIGGEVSDG